MGQPCLQTSSVFCHDKMMTIHVELWSVSAAVPHFAPPMKSAVKNANVLALRHETQKVRCARHRFDASVGKHECVSANALFSACNHTVVNDDEVSRHVSTLLTQHTRAQDVVIMKISEMTPVELRDILRNEFRENAKVIVHALDDCVWFCYRGGFNTFECTLAICGPHEWCIQGLKSKPLKQRVFDNVEQFGQCMRDLMP